MVAPYGHTITHMAGRGVSVLGVFVVVVSASMLSEEYMTQVMACALIAGRAFQDDPTFTAVITDSVHDPDTTIAKLMAEVCLHCVSHISPDLASHIMETGLDPENDSVLQDLLRYNQTKYLAKEASLDLTQEEEDLMDLLLELVTDEEDEDGYGDYEDYEDYGDDEELETPPGNWEL